MTTGRPVIIENEGSDGVGTGAGTQTGGTTPGVGIRGWLSTIAGKLQSTIAVTLPSVANSIKISPVGNSKTVTTSGTGVPLVASTTPAKILYVRAKTTNTGNIYFGDSTVDVSTSKQIILAPTQSVTINAESGFKIDLVEQYIDADVNGEGVDFLYEA